MGVVSPKRHPDITRRKRRQTKKIHLKDYFHMKRIILSITKIFCCKKGAQKKSIFRGFRNLFPAKKVTEKELHEFVRSELEQFLKHPELCTKIREIVHEELEKIKSESCEVKIAKAPQISGKEIQCRATTSSSLSSPALKESNPHDKDKSLSQISDGWSVVAGSVIGNGHIKGNIPCQDNHGHKAIDDKWGICVVSDGAGSAKRSHEGSEFTCKKVIEYCSKWLNDKKLQEIKSLPSEEQWADVARKILGKIGQELYFKAENENVDMQVFACTCMFVVYTPFGLLTAHIGDGRGGYFDKDKNEWLPLFKPHSGEEANQTIFITNEWFKARELGGVPLPETHVIAGNIDAFCLMSDGMEKSVFDCAIWDEGQQKYVDLNCPNAKVMDNLVQTLRKKFEDKEDLGKIEESWKNLLIEGTPRIKNETDDKTLLVAINSNQ